MTSRTVAGITSPQDVRTHTDSRYLTIDGWRGLAALFVVIHHVSPLKYGHEAVMLFFVISGYCIAAAAHSGLEKDMGYATFMYRRFRRIYPPFVLSLAYFAAKGVAKLVLIGENDLSQWTIVEWIQNVTMTQWFTLVANPQPLPFMNDTLVIDPYWSLLYEEQFYLIVGALMLASRSWGFNLNHLLHATTAVSLVWLVAFGENCTGFFIDYWPMFGVGVLAYARISSRNQQERLYIDALLVSLFVGCLAVYLTAERVALGFGEFERIRERELLVCVGFALLLVVMKPWDAKIASTSVWPVFRFLGLISYSLYLTHFILVSLVARAVGVLPVELPMWLDSMVQVLIHVCLATGFWYFCERPFLNRPYEATQPTHD